MTTTTLNTNQPTSFHESRSNTILWISSALLLLAIIFARAVYPELLWLTMITGMLLVASLGTLVFKHKSAMKSRTIAYGVNSLITVLLVLAIVGVLNFLASRYPQKIDLTKNKVHTLSDQTVKVVKGINQPMKATFFGKVGSQANFRPLLENYKNLNPKFELEFIDPDREVTRVRETGIKKADSLFLSIGSRQTVVEEISEEKITNSLIKILRDRVPVLCSLSGHGEKSFDSNDADGFASMKKSLLEQSYETRTLNLLQEGKIPETCDTVTILGATKAFFPQEIQLIRDYLARGGRAVIGLDINVKGGEYAPELLGLLREWSIQTTPAMVIDPISKQMGVDASVPLLVTYSKESAITKDFQGNCYFPFLRPLDILPGVPTSLNVQWLAKTTPAALAIGDMKQLASGQIAIDPNKVPHGPFTSAIAVEGKVKGSAATKPTRLVVFGTSTFANNNFSRFGSNSDFFLNSVSWAMEDTQMISIRAKEDGTTQLEVSSKLGAVIGWLILLVIPAAIAGAGVMIWNIRRKL